MEDERNLVYAPRAQRDLLSLPKRYALQILEDLELLQEPPWPPGKVKKLHGHDFWEIKTGSYRTIFLPRGKDVIILRIINRRDLEKTLGRINIRTLIEWIREREQDK